jgi:hypothetical protein
MVNAIFGIESNALNLIVTLGLLFLIAVWVALIIYTYTDAKRRISDPFLVACATAASLFPFVGTLVYTILRPPEFLEDSQERELETRASEAELRRLRATSCRRCGFPAEPDFLRCPSCRSQLREPCPSCSRAVGMGWRVCPYCEHTLIEPRRKPGAKKGGGDRTEKTAASRDSKPDRTPPRSTGGERAGRPEAKPRQAGSRPSEGRQDDEGSRWPFRRSD